MKEQTIKEYKAEHKLKSKVCTKCGADKALSEFRTRVIKNRNNYFYTLGQCKKCLKELNKVWRHENIEKMREYSREYKRNNPIIVSKKELERKALYRMENREKIRENAKIYYVNSIEKIKKQKKINRKKSAKFLTDGYIKGILRAKSKYLLSQTLIPNEIIKLKRIQLKIYRELQRG